MVPTDEPTPTADGGSNAASKHAQGTATTGTDTDQDLPDLKKVIWAWLVRYLGRRRALVLLLVGALVYVLIDHWGSISRWPLVREAKSYFSNTSLPRADPNRFAVAIAHLEHDRDSTCERLIVEALRDLKEIQILRFDRTISLEGGDAQAAAIHGHDQARRYLQETGAQVLVWGTVVRGDTKSIPKLYWTTNNQSRSERGPGRYQITEDLALPDIFWDDLATVLRLLVFSTSADFSARQGRYIGKELSTFIERVRRLRVASEQTRRWSPEARTEVTVILARSLTAFSSQGGSNRDLREAIELYRETLRNCIRDSSEDTLPLPTVPCRTDSLRQVSIPFLTTVLYDLGVALSTLGERESGRDQLEEAVTIFRGLLKSCPRDQAPVDWGMAQTELGTALMSLGEREEGTFLFDSAVAAYREALTACTRDRAPLRWAMIQNNLGNALRRMGVLESDTGRLEEAITAYHESLRENTRDRAPSEWAMAEENLGNALSALGQLEPGTGRLEEAEAAFLTALKEYTPDRWPLQWAITQHDLANVLSSLGSMRGEKALMCEALRRHLMAWKAFSNGAPYDAGRAAKSIRGDLTELDSAYLARNFEDCLSDQGDILVQFIAWMASAPADSTRAQPSGPP